MSNPELLSKVRAAVRQYRGIAEKLALSLYAEPEISKQEFESSKKITTILKEHGFLVEYPYCGIETAFRACIDNGQGPAVAIMAEYDALPELGHGCGHNLHGSLSVLAALALASLKDSFKGKLYVIGTPFEETDGAKVPMSEAGVFDGLALAVMMHSVGGGIAQPNFDVLSLRNWTVSFYGKSAHAAAAPWHGHSAQSALRKFLDLVDARRECFTPDVRFSAIITESGKAVNIIPEFAQAIVEFRTDAKGKLDKLDETVKKCAEGAAMALDCTVKWKRNYDDFADMVRVRALEEEAERLLVEAGIKTQPVAVPIGSSDVGNVSYRCPALQPFIPITDENFALHTKDFADATTKPQAFEAMAKGAEVIALLCLKSLNDEAFRKTVEAGWKEALQTKLGA